MTTTLEKLPTDKRNRTVVERFVWLKANHWIGDWQRNSFGQWFARPMGREDWVRIGQLNCAEAYLAGAFHMIGRNADGRP